MCVAQISRPGGTSQYQFETHFRICDFPVSIDLSRPPSEESWRGPHAVAAGRFNLPLVRRAPTPDSRRASLGCTGSGELR